MKKTPSATPLAEVMQRIKQAATTEISPEVNAIKWDYIAYDKGLENVLPAVKQFTTAVLNNSQPKRWLSLLGPSGVGKTHILKQAIEVIRARWRIKTNTGWRGPNAARIIPAKDLTDWKAALDYAKYDIIYIEDIGSGQGVDGASGKVIRNRIMELLQLRSGKWTMLDANLYRAEIETLLDGRIASRLKRDGSWMVEIPPETPDFWEVGGK
jgi:chromosomal replication initiation ATPase DnaA